MSDKNTLKQIIEQLKKASFKTPKQLSFSELCSLILNFKSALISFLFKLNNYIANTKDKINSSAILDEVYEFSIQFLNRVSIYKFQLQSQPKTANILLCDEMLDDLVEEVNKIEERIVFNPPSKVSNNNSKQIKKQEETIKELTEKINQQNQTIENLHKEIKDHEELENKIEEKRKILEDLNRQIEISPIMIDKTLNKKRRKVDELDAKWCELVEDCEKLKKEKENIEKSIEMAKSDKLISKEEHESQISSLVFQNSRMKEIIEEARNKIQELQRQINQSKHDEEVDKLLVKMNNFAPQNSTQDPTSQEPQDDADPEDDDADENAASFLKNQFAGGISLDGLT